MSLVTEHLERGGYAFEVIPHPQAFTSIDEARALGVDAGEVLKTLALRTASGYALLVIPASRRLDLRLAREAVGDNRARLATEEELVRDFAGYQLGALPIVGRRQLETVLAGYIAHYNQHRPHRSLGMSHRWELSPTHSSAWSSGSAAGPTRWAGS